MADLRNLLQIEKKESSNKKTYFMFEQGKSYYNSAIQVRNDLGALANELVGMFLAFLNKAPDQDVKAVIEQINKYKEKPKKQS